MHSEDHQERVLNQFHFYSFFLIAIIAAYHLNHGSFDFFQDSKLGRAYDALAQSILDFRVDIKPHQIWGESFIREDKCYMYFGPFPVIFRLILNPFFPQLFGLWASLSKFFAYLISLFFLTKTTLLCLEKNSQLKLIYKQIIVLVSMIGFGLGSPLFSLMTHLSLYYEVLIWGLSLSIVSIYFILKYYAFDNTHSTMPFAYISILAGLTLLTRLAFAIPLILILLYICFDKFKQKEFNFKRILFILSPLILCFSLQLWYNQTRFGSPFSFANYKYYGKWLKIKETDEKKYLEKASIQLIHYDRIAFNLKAYFGYDDQLFKNKYPFLNPYRAKYPKKTEIPSGYEFIGQVFPIPFIYSWLFIFSLIGLFKLFKSKRSFFFSKEAILLYCFSLQAINILMYKALNHRYTAEFMPLAIYLYFYSLFLLEGNKSALSNIKLYLLVLLTIISAFTTSSYAVSWRAFSYFGPIKNEKQECKTFISKVNNFIPNKMKEYLIKIKKLEGNNHD